MSGSHTEYHKSHLRSTHCLNASVNSWQLPTGRQSEQINPLRQSESSACDTGSDLVKSRGKNRDYWVRTCVGRLKGIQRSNARRHSFWCLVFRMGITLHSREYEVRMRTDAQATTYRSEEMQDGLDLPYADGKRCQRTINCDKKMSND